MFGSEIFKLVVMFFLFFIFVFCSPGVRDYRQTCNTVIQGPCIPKVTHEGIPEGIPRVYPKGNTVVTPKCKDATAEEP